MTDSGRRGRERRAPDGARFFASIAMSSSAIYRMIRKEQFFFLTPQIMEENGGGLICVLYSLLATRNFER